MSASGQQSAYTKAAFFLAGKLLCRTEYQVQPQYRQARLMKDTFRALLHGALIPTFFWLTSPAAALEPDKVLFVGDHGSYVGSYDIRDRSIAVVIDGLPYRGHFSDKITDLGRPSVDGDNLRESWGRAFLFASSAKVMQCALDAGFPNVSGRCHDADGRLFKLMPTLKL